MNILAIDDDVDFHALLKLKLNAAEFNLTLCLTEQEFFEKLKSETKFDVILLDLSIGENPLKGLEILSKVRGESQDDVPVIVLSNTDAKKVISSALELGANDFVPKPLNATLLIDKINALVTGNQAFAKKLKFGNFPGKQPNVIMSTRLTLKAVTEIGLLIEGNAYIAKGARVKIKSKRMLEIFGIDTIEVFSTGFATEESGVYLTTFEIDPENKDFINKAKLWIKSNQK